MRRAQEREPVHGEYGAQSDEEGCDMQKAGYGLQHWIGTDVTGHPAHGGQDGAAQEPCRHEKPQRRVGGLGLLRGSMTGGH
ncbi:hypothetical protein [Streptomyces sp. SLBN-118]|uniref:hypothetical protein n=1 Tax=Streptomyces sp. SLBN-118 TaxID=2768454 RepID=UPI00115171A4|nr:hypothetical protein [Streptomyces sp. SLBN-118]